MCGRITQDLNLKMLFDQYRLSETAPGAPEPTERSRHARQSATLGIKSPRRHKKPAR